MRLKFLIFLMMIVWVTLIGRIYYLTILRGEHYGKLAIRNTIKEEPLLPVRGTIFDRNGFPLAVNRLGFVISLSPHLSKGGARERLENALDYFLSIVPIQEDKETLRARYLKSDSVYSHEAVELTPFVPYELILPWFTRLSLHPDIHISPTTLRHYPNGNIASHVLGYVSRADRGNRSIDPVSLTIGYHGRAGLEQYYNKELQGTLGNRTYRVTALNSEIEEIRRVEPSQEQYMTLHLDIRLQQFIHELYEKEGRLGVALVMDLASGGIIAAGSYPEYDNEKFVTGISVAEWQVMNNDIRHPFINKMVNSHFPPGSVIKPSVALAFMESGLLTPQTEFHCGGAFAFAGRDFRCWRPRGHGDVKLRRAITESCDIYFYRGSLLVGIDTIAQKLKAHGFGAKTGVDLPNEYMGVVPSREWKMERYQKAWFTGETLISSIGQGSFLATPMQVLANISLIATGKLITPTFAKTIADEQMALRARDVFSESDKFYIDEIRKGLEAASMSPRGTSARAMAGLPVKIAGKTGTAQVVSIPQDEKQRMSESELEFNMRSHAWFAGYAPTNKPRYAIVVFVEHGMSGGAIAAPVAAQILRKMIELNYFK
ncbi:MAG: penicillin-binding protein 2 [Helicobacteraceae bacterium]|jgi:penicillin-binding protein 2|nr:penicillin-binding protein 2 [Helicobacteraceae bacterium]